MLTFLITAALAAAPGPSVATATCAPARPGANPCLAQVQAGSASLPAFPVRMDAPRPEDKSEP